MGTDKETKTFTSENHTNNIKYYIYLPDDEPKGIIQILHGMCEYFKLYESLINYFTLQGYIVCGNDHLGHGSSVKKSDDLGYFAEKDGYICLVEDVNSLTKIMKQKYKVLPYILVGYDMGSFILRQYITKYAEHLDGVIIIGTTDEEYLSKIWRKPAISAERKKGGEYRNEKLHTELLNSFSKKISNPRTKFDWLSRDASYVDSYANDEKCNFVFSNSAFDDLYALLNQITSKDWAQKVPTNLPILMLSGQEDPIGNFGKGIKKINKSLINACVEDVKIKIYEGCRHNILNELNKKEIYKDIFEWINEHTKGF